MAVTDWKSNNPSGRDNQQGRTKLMPYPARVFHYNEMTTDMAYLLGVLLSDGHVHKRKGRENYSFELTTTDLDFARRTNEALESATGYKGKIKVSKTHRQRQRYKKIVYRLRLFHNALCRWFIEVTENRMSIPHDILHGDKPLRVSFFCGYFDGDGKIYETRQGAYGAQIAGVNRNIIVAVRDLCNGLGIVAHRVARYGQTTSGKDVWYCNLNVDSMIRAGCHSAIQRKQVLFDAYRDRVRPHRPRVQPLTVIDEGDDMVGSARRRAEAGGNGNDLPQCQTLSVGIE